MPLVAQGLSMTASKRSSKMGNPSAYAKVPEVILRFANHISSDECSTHSGKAKRSKTSTLRKSPILALGLVRIAVISVEPS